MAIFTKPLMLVAALAVGAFAMTGSRVGADTLPAPTGEVLLTIDGAIGSHNADAGLELDMALLKSLPAISFETGTQWTEGKQTFTGVPVKAVLAAAQAQGASVSAVALNDYVIEMALDELEDDVPIIAYEIDGAPFSRRDKGPLWIVYPYDRDEKYRTEKTFGASIWQLVRLTVH